jgi:hypothetical protein
LDRIEQKSRASVPLSWYERTTMKASKFADPWKAFILK